MDKNLHTYLISEYERALEEPLYVKINGKDVLMPFVYALKYSNEKEATDNFKVDFFNHTDENVYAIMSPYEAHQKEPKFVWFDNIQFPVPYEARNLSEAEPKDEKGLRNRYSRAEYIPQEDYSIDWNYATQLAMLEQGRK